MLPITTNTNFLQIPPISGLPSKNMKRPSENTEGNLEKKPRITEIVQYKKKEVEELSSNFDFLPYDKIVEIFSKLDMADLLKLVKMRNKYINGLANQVLITNLKRHVVDTSTRIEIRANLLMRSINNYDFTNDNNEGYKVLVGGGQPKLVKDFLERKMLDPTIEGFVYLNIAATHGKKNVLKRLLDCIQKKWKSSVEIQTSLMKSMNIALLNNDIETLKVIASYPIVEFSSITSILKEAIDGKNIHQIELIMNLPRIKNNLLCLRHYLMLSIRKNNIELLQVVITLNKLDINQDSHEIFKRVFENGYKEIAEKILTSFQLNASSKLMIARLAICNIKNVKNLIRVFELLYPNGFSHTDEDYNSMTNLLTLASAHPNTETMKEILIFIRKG